MCIECERRNRAREDEDDDYYEDYYEDEESEPLDDYESAIDDMEDKDGEDIADMIGLPSPDDIYGGTTSDMLKGLRDSVIERFKDDLDSDGIDDVIRRWNSNGKWSELAEAYIPTDDNDVMYIVWDLHLLEYPEQDSYTSISRESIIAAFRNILHSKLEQVARAIMQTIRDSS